MAWTDEMTTIVRYLVDDIDGGSPTYSDARIQTTVLVSAQLVSNDVDFDLIYTINVDAGTLSPDPTTPNRDDPFINLVSLRTAVIILSSELKTQGLSAVKVSDGPSNIDMSKTPDGIKAVYNEMLEKYEDAKLQYKTGGVVGEAILSPYSPGANVVNGNYGRRGYYQ